MRVDAAGASADGTFGTAANSARIGRIRPHETPAKTKMSNVAPSAPAARDTTAEIAFKGPDAAKFLQGQLSADIGKLAVGGTTLAGLHNPQGRVIALLRVSRAAPEDFRASLPRELVPTVASRLRKFVLRARVSVEERPPVDGNEVSAALTEVRAGIPQVYAATSEAFVAQMLNLDLLDAIAFDKGCYTGQEVIARAHYRGRVKRRLQRWLNRSGTELAPGDAARGPDGRALAVVRVAAVDAGQEVLAVGNYGSVSDDAAADGADCAVRLEGPLPLPYALPG
jgi:folate-binding protein YgfZ